MGEKYLANETEFYESLESNQEYRTAQLLHIEEAFKIDLFLLREDEYTTSELGRALLLDIGNGVRLRMLAPENIVLPKLRWFVAGGSVSDRQWTDLVQVLETQAAGLDLAYLAHWAEVAKLEALLQKALEESSLGN